MIKRFMNRTHRDQKGITGLETAIILIAFVVVAAVFAFTALSAGLFSTEKSKEAVYSGLQETRSTMELRTGVSAYMALPANIHEADGVTDLADTSSRVITRLDFMISNVLGGESIDLHPSHTGDLTGITASSPDLHHTVITLTDANVSLSDCAWTVAWVGDENGDFNLDNGEKAVITVWLINNDTGAWKLGASGSTTFYSDDENVAATQLIDKNHEFTLQVKPQSGAILTIERTTPAYLDTVIDLQ